MIQGFCGNEEPHEQHEVWNGNSDLYPIEHLQHFTCRGVDEEGHAITEERTPIRDCEE